MRPEIKSEVTVEVRAELQPVIEAEVREELTKFFDEKYELAKQ